MIRIALVVAFCAALPLAAELTLGARVPEGKALPVVVDLNGDGLTDLVQDRVVLLNQGAGVFLSRDLGLAHDDRVMDWLDANGDGRPDLLTRERRSSGSGPSAYIYRVYLADERMRFPTRHTIETTEFFEPYIAEVNGDGKEDLVLEQQLFVGNKNVATEMKVLLSKGDGTFTARPPFRFARNAHLGLYHRLLAGDVDRDGRRDLVVRTNEELVVLRGIGNGELAAAEERYLPWSPFGWWETELEDVDRDGNLDVVMAGFRVVRVLFGDGRGGFPRVSYARVAKLRETIIPPFAQVPHPPELPPVTPDTNPQPRTLAFGEFIGKGRTEIAAGTGEGDVVIFAIERGALREVGRIATELLSADVHAGAFFARGRTDLYVTWNFFYPPERPQSRLLYADPKPVDEPQPVAGRTRAVRGSMVQTTRLHVEASGGCVNVDEQWTLTREGIFGIDRAHGVETAMESGLLAFRLTAPWAPEPVQMTLQANGRSYEGALDIVTNCGAQVVTFRATPR